MPSDKNLSNDITIPQKYLDKIVKLQQDQDKVRQEEYALLREHLSQTNALLSELVKVSATGSTVAATKKIIPFHTGSQLVGQLLIPPSIDTPPPNPDDYPTQINLYAQNDNRPIQHMTLINDGPGDIFFVVGYSETDVNRKEGKLHVNDQRELFNVYQIRMRATLPETTFRLIEGIFRTGSVAPQTVINTTIRPSIQANQALVHFAITFDNFLPITITSPTVQTLPIDQSFFGLSTQPPLPPGVTATLVNQSTGSPMPFLIPGGFSLELFSVFTNFSTDFTLRTYFEAVPESGVFSENAAFPSSSRGVAFNQSANLSSPFSTQPFFPSGVPEPGIKTIVTITNDDPFNNMVGDVEFLTILSRLT